MIHYDVSEGVCTLRLEAPPLNALSFALLDALRGAIRRAEQDADVRGIVLGGTPRHFSAGADLGIFAQLRSAEAAIDVCRRFQEAFQEIEDSSKPVIAALAGKVMGGALELAMACHFRVATAESRFSMPEVRLGINPGAGGTQRLPRLIGPAASLRMLLTGESRSADEALTAGLIDRVCPAESLFACACEVARAGSTPRRRAEAQERLSSCEAAFAEAERQVAKTRAEIVAPRVILKAVRAGIEDSLEAGLRCEREGFAECVATPAAGNKIHLFFATRQAAKIPEADDVPHLSIARAAVIGMGTMGTGIAQSLLASGLEVMVCDEDPSALDRGQKKIHQSLLRQVEQGRLDAPQAAATLGRLTSVGQWDALAGADLVVEAVFEDLAVKQRMFARLEEVCRPEAILASNTSTISLDLLSQCMRRPDRLIGLHFFNPAHRMPLLEVIRPARSSSQTVASAMRLAKTLGKTPVLVMDRAGFIVSRLFVPYLKEAFWLLEEGAPPEAIDAAMVAFGFPMGPLALIDMAGLDILNLTDRVLRQAFPHHGELPTSAARLVERGQLGQKTGAGVYRYDAGSHVPQRSAATDDLLAEVRRERGITARPIEAGEIAQRLVLRMVSEAYGILADGIAQRASDLDVAVVLGIGFPDFRGGVVRYAEERGLDRVREELEELTARCGGRFAPCSLLSKKGS
jgi:3-hydroxyacyl-CoA dehydrogenase